MTKGEIYTGTLLNVNLSGKAGLGKDEVDYGRAKLEVKGPSLQGEGQISISTNPKLGLYGKTSLSEITGKTSIGNADFGSIGEGLVISKSGVKLGVHLGVGSYINVGW